MCSSMLDDSIDEWCPSGWEIGAAHPMCGVERSTSGTADKGPSFSVRVTSKIPQNAQHFASVVSTTCGVPMKDVFVVKTGANACVVVHANDLEHAHVLASSLSRVGAALVVPSASLEVESKSAAISVVFDGEKPGVLGRGATGAGGLGLGATGGAADSAPSSQSVEFNSSAVVSPPKALAKKRAKKSWRDWKEKVMEVLHLARQPRKVKPSENSSLPPSAATFLRDMKRDADAKMKALMSSKSGLRKSERQAAARTVKANFDKIHACVHRTRDVNACVTTKDSATKPR